MRFLLTMVLTTIPIFSSAETQGEGASMTLASNAACKTCDDMKKQEEWFNKKHALVPQQRIEAVKATESVLANSERLHEESQDKRGKNFYQEFESLVGLVAASLPFDMETQGAADIAAIVMSKDAQTEAIYKRALSQVRDKCRQEFLRVTVEDRICNLQFDDSKAPENDRFKKCPVSKYNYEDCEAKQKGKS